MTYKELVAAEPQIRDLERWARRENDVIGPGEWTTMSQEHWLAVAHMTTELNTLVGRYRFPRKDNLSTEEAWRVAHGHLVGILLG